MKERLHQHYAKRRTGNWFRVLLARAGLAGAPKGTTIGPVPYITNKAGPNRRMRRHTASIWRRYGEKAMKIAKKLDISIDKALRIAMEA